MNPAEQIAFANYAEALASALSATLEPYDDDREPAWRTRLALPDGTSLFLRRDKDKIALWPLGPNGRLLDRAKGASLSANPRAMAKRVLALLEPGGHWHAALAYVKQAQEKEREALARSEAAAAALRADGWEVRTGHGPGSFHAYRKTSRQTLAAEIQTGGSVSFRNLYVTAAEAVAIAAAL